MKPIVMFYCVIAILSLLYGCGYTSLWYEAIPQEIELSGWDLYYSIYPTVFKPEGINKERDSLYYVTINVTHKDSSSESDVRLEIQNVSIVVRESRVAVPLVKFKEPREAKDSFEPNKTWIVYTFGPFNIGQQFPDTLRVQFTAVEVDNIHARELKRIDLKFMGVKSESRESVIKDFLRGY